MDFEDIIEYCDGLPFLSKGEIKYHDEVAIAENITYELKTDQGCSICFYISGYIEYRVKKGSMNYWKSFEDFFEGLSPEGKENIIFHLDVFESKSRLS